MFRKILVPTDGSDFSTAAVQSAIELAAATRASLVALHVYPSFRGGAYGTAESARAALAEAHAVRTKSAGAVILEDVLARCLQAGVAGEVVMMESERPWQAIIAVAQRKRCDAICMASHGRRGLAGVVLGSETAKVLTHCTLPVLVIR